jgi:cytochrome c553
MDYSLNQKRKKNTAMMPWQSRLTSEEIRAVAYYICKELMTAKE